MSRDDAELNHRQIDDNSQTTVGVLLNRDRYRIAILAVLGSLILAQPVRSQTLPPEKQAIQQQYTTERAAGAASPAPKNPFASYPIVPEQPFITGIVNDGDAPFSSEHVKIVNYWQGILNGVRTYIYAGSQTAEGTNPQQGVLIIQTTPDYPLEGSTAPILTPVQAGPVSIVAAQDGTILAVSATGSYVFTLNTNTGTITSRIQPATIVASSQISVTSSGLVYSRTTQTFSGTLTLKNLGTTPISGPVSVVFTSLPGGVTLANGTGTFSGAPFITAPGITTVIAPGASANINVQFANPSNVPITLTPVVYSGSLN
jgi:hypothetical protein